MEGLFRQQKYDEPKKFCVYEGPLDAANYWQYFRIISEDYHMLRFYQLFTNKNDNDEQKTDDDNSTQASPPTFNSKVTCHNLIYNYSVSLTNGTDYQDLDSFIIHRFLFRGLIQLSEIVFNNAIKYRLPLLIYVRPSHFTPHTNSNVTLKSSQTEE